LPILPRGRVAFEEGTGDLAVELDSWAFRAYSSRLVTRGTATAAATAFFKKLLRVVLDFIFKP
jgi:hypothetical protein